MANEQCCEICEAIEAYEASKLVDPDTMLYGMVLQAMREVKSNA